MKRFLMATALAVALSGVALGGNIPTGGIAPPPPPPPDETTITGEIPMVGFTSSSDGVSIFLTVLGLVF